MKIEHPSRSLKPTYPSGVGITAMVAVCMLGIVSPSSAAEAPVQIPGTPGKPVQGPPGVPPIKPVGGKTESDASSENRRRTLGETPAEALRTRGEMRAEPVRRIGKVRVEPDRKAVADESRVQPEGQSKIEPKKDVPLVAGRMRAEPRPPKDTPDEPGKKGDPPSRKP